MITRSKLIYPGGLQHLSGSTGVSCIIAEKINIYETLNGDGSGENRVKKPGSREHDIKRPGSREIK